MAAPRVMTGCRAKVQIIDSNNIARTIGIFSNVSWGFAYDVVPLYILGRISPADIVYTASTPVQVTASGWRVLGHGGHVEGGLPRIQDLLNSDYITIVIEDRLAKPGDAPVAVVKDVRTVSYTTSVTARQVEEISVSFMGMLTDDESTQNIEPGVDLPPAQ